MSNGTPFPRPSERPGEPDPTHPGDPTAPSGTNGSGSGEPEQGEPTRVFPRLPHDRSDEPEPTQVIPAAEPDQDDPAPGSRAGRRRAAEAPKGPSPVTVLGGMALGIVLTGIAWALLVIWAIDHGRNARDDGSASDWILMVIGAVAATVFLGIFLWLISQLLRLIGWLPRRRKRS